MIRRYEVVCTMTISGNERDATVRAHVEVGWDVGSPNGYGAVLDGDAEIRIGRQWVPVDSADLAEGDIARLTEALEEEALNDDSASCVDYDDDRSCA